MAKKNIISDFASLKGKISFSEPAPAAPAKIEKTEKKDIKPEREPETVLRKGQKVVLMDSDLRGRIVSLGRTVGIELEFQMATFRRIIRENLSHRGMKICFIHGVGDGILKAAIRKELDEGLALRCSYSVGDPAVTVVSIK